MRRHFSIYASSLQEDFLDHISVVCFNVGGSSWFEFWPEVGHGFASEWGYQFVGELAVLVFVFECWADSGHCEKKSASQPPNKWRDMLMGL